MGRPTSRGFDVGLRRSMQSGALVFAAVAICGLLVACLGGNGLPGSVRTLLHSRGVDVQFISAEAPLDSRAGLLEIQHDADLEARIVDALSLARLTPSDSGYAGVASRIPGVAGTVWGLSGRPSVLRLADGGQFEYLYLVVTSDQRAFIIVEYAYG